MAKSQPRRAIVNVSSAARRSRGGAGLGYYAMTKHAVEVMSEALRAEVGKFGVRVIVVEPGAIDSSFPQNRVVAGFDAPAYQELGKAFFARLAESRAAVYPPGMVAAVIADALEEDRPRLRRPASPDAVKIIEYADSLDEATFETNFWSSVQK